MDSSSSSSSSAKESQLDRELTTASRKFYKSCDQIKLIKRRIGELVAVFTTCEQEINRMNSQRIAASAAALSRFESRLSSSRTINNLNNNNSNNNSNTPNSKQSSGRGRGPNFDEINDECNLMEEDENDDNLKHLAAFRETTRMQIENLHCVQTAYLMYAQRKADEITRIQCELYGEDVVRAVYERDNNNSNNSILNNDPSINNQEQESANQEEVGNWTNNNDTIAATATTVQRNNQVLEFLTA